MAVGLSVLEAGKPVCLKFFNVECAYVFIQFGMLYLDVTEKIYCPDFYSIDRYTSPMLIEECHDYEIVFPSLSYIVPMQSIINRKILIGYFEGNNTWYTLTFDLGRKEKGALFAFHLYDQSKFHEMAEVFRK